MRRWLLLLGILLFSSLVTANAEESFDIAKYYSELSESYIKAITNKDYKTAYSVAVEQLKLDPADTVAYLRMAIAAQHIDLNRNELSEMYSQEISERDSLHRQIKAIASALLSERNH